MLYIVNCGIPEIPFALDNESTPVVVDYVDDTTAHVPVSVYTENSTVRFSCSSGFKLIGPDSVTCTENGDWVPDPSGIVCNMSLEGECAMMHKLVPTPCSTHTIIV